MEQNASSHLIPPAFSAESFSAQFPGINAAANNASPLLMSTLHLSGFSNASAQTFLPSATSQIALGGQFPADLANVASAAWTTQPQPWFDQAKVAAMLPMYGMLPQSVTAVSDSRMFNNQASKSFLPSVSVGFEQPERFSTASTSQASQSLGQCSSTPSSASFDSRASPQRPCRVSSRVSSITVNSPSMVSSHPKTSTTTSSHPPSNERLVRCSPMVATSQANSSLPMTPACTLVNSPSTSKSLEKTATEATVTPSVPGSVANGPDAATPSEQRADIESIFTNDGDAHTAVPNMNASGHFTFDHHPHPSTSHLTAGGSTMNGGIDHSTFDDLSWTKDINLDDFHLNYDSTADFHALLSSDLTNELLKTDTSKSKDKFTADDFDKEFERHLNAVANNHAKTTSLPIFDAFSSLLSTDILKKDDKLQDENISLHNPVKFTPPDSPCSSIGGDNEDFDDNAASATYNGSAKLKHPKAESMLDMLSFLPKIEAYKQPVKVPVYKQRNHNNVFLFNEKEKEKADEYDFSDDDEKDDSPFTSFFNRDVPKEPVSVLSDKAAAFSGLSQAATALDQSETEVSPQKSQLVESIRKRRELRALSSFLHAESLTDDFETAVTDFVGPSSSQSVIKKEVEAEERSEENNNVPEELPPLPKLYIKIHRKDSVGKTKDKKKKKKKRRKKERDHEWEGSDRPKKKKKKKHKKDRERQDSSSGYEARLVSETESWKPPAAGSGEAPVFSRKRRLMMQWNEAEAEASERNDESRKRLRLSSPARERKEQFEEQWNPHLIKFSQAHGNLAKGTFVVSKHDLVRIENCALWRVDNQNLLQKYPPVVDQKTGKKMYRNSSTYSGWCDQIAGGYLTVATKYMKHSRAESIVEPEIPLADLFPAISEEVEDRMTVAGDSCEKAEEPREVLCFGKDSLRVNLQTYLQAMLNHAFSLSFLQSIKQANEWNYLCSLNEIDKANAEAKARIKERVRWNENFIEMVQQYSFCSSNDSDLSNIPCQACNYDPTSSILQLFSNEFYDYDTLEPKMFLNSGGDSPLPAIEFLVCSGCQQLAVLYHRFHHMRYALLKKCEDKIELVSSENPNYTINEVIETCMKQLNWVRKISEEYLLGWKRVSQV